MRALFTITILAAFIGFCWFFESRRSRPPSVAESALATAWLWFRRLVCFIATSLCALVAGLLLVQIVRGEMPLTGIIGVVLAVAFGFIIFHWGLYGMGRKRYDFLEDKPIHEERKRRYGWRW